MIRNKVLNEALQSILAILGMCLVVYIFIWIDQKETNEILQNGVKTIGVMYPRLGKVFVRYRVGAKEYSTYQNSPFSSIQKGEKYVITVDKRDFNNILIQFDKPVILAKDLVYFRKTRGHSIETLFFEYDGDIKITYKIRDQLFERFQRISMNFKIDYSKSSVYEIIYDVRNPQIAYLILPNIPLICPSND